MIKVQNLTNQIDALQVDLENNPEPIIAMVLTNKYNKLEQLGFEYNVFTKTLTFIFLEAN